MGLKRKRYIRGGGEEILSTFPRKELVTQLTGMQLECGGGRGRKVGRGKLQKKWNYYKIKFLLQEGRKENIKKKEKHECF